MKKLILLLFISTFWTQKLTARDLKAEIAILKHEVAKLNKEVNAICKKLKKISKLKKKENSLLKKAFVKFISDSWSVVIAHLKRWYMALVIVILVWYNSNLPFPWRDKIANYFQ